jgi:uncharacterized protein (DUF4415 family)
MKSGDTSRKFPASPEDWEALVQEAPGDDRSPTPEEEARWEKGVVVKEGGYPAVRAALAERRRRGPQKASTKVFTGIRLDADVIDAFKATGPGWQTRMNAALREWLEAHRRAD